jgi:hypothetical protein
MLSIDLPTQRVAEEALVDKRAALVAIDPQNGDVIALVSRPGFDPNLFGRGLTRAEFAALNENIDKPLLNRALRGAYPPGSTVKPVMALAGLYYKVDPHDHQYCGGVYRLPGSSRCSARAGPAGTARSTSRRPSPNLVTSTSTGWRPSWASIASPPSCLHSASAGSPASTSAASGRASCPRANGRRTTSSARRIRSGSRVRP